MKIRTSSVHLTALCLLTYGGLAQNEPPQALIVSLTLDPQSVRVLHLQPGFVSSVRLPEEVSSVVLGQITLGKVRPVGCVAVAHDGRQTVAMLLRREGETLTQVFTRLDLAIAKAFTEGTCTDEVNPISQQYFPTK